MSFTELKCTEFIDILATKAPVPGGGGASALVGAIGTALGSMVGDLTVGKKKYAAVEEDVIAIMTKAKALQQRFIDLVAADAEVFEPLSKAYGIPKDDPDRADIMEKALVAACSVPLDIMHACCEAIELHEELAEKGSMIAISDVGVGVICCKSALMGASLNVYINTKSMANREYAEKTEAEADDMIQKYCLLADKVYSAVVNKLR